MFRAVEICSLQCIKVGCVAMSHCFPTLSSAGVPGCCACVLVFVLLPGLLPVCMIPLAIAPITISKLSCTAVFPLCLNETEQYSSASAEYFRCKPVLSGQALRHLLWANHHDHDHHRALSSDLGSICCLFMVLPICCAGPMANCFLAPVPLTMPALV